MFAEREGDNWYRLEGDFAQGFSRAESLRAGLDVELLAPIEPAKIVCVGLNYLAHVTENDPTRTVPEEPVLFMKPPSSVIGPEATIRIANPENRTDYEAELAVIIGKTARNIAAAEAFDHIFGYTCANDVSDRVLQKKDGQWVRAKGYDTYCPVGPWIETELDLDSAQVESFLNGEARQSQGASTMLFPLPELISFMSGVMTLNPGDLILTGTPEGVGPMANGDRIEVSVSGIGTLANPVIAS